MGAVGKFIIDKDVDSIVVDDGGNSLTVDASDLDIRDLAYGTDSITAWQGGTWDIGTVSTVTSVTAVVGITNDVNIADGGNSITVDASDLDIRDLSHTTDSVAIGDGTTLAYVNPLNNALLVEGNLSVDDTQNVANLAQNIPVTSTAVALPTAPLAGRERMIISNLGPTTVELGSAAVTFGAGLPLPKGDSVEVWVGPNNLVYGICNTALTANLRIWELS